MAVLLHPSQRGDLKKKHNLKLLHASWRAERIEREKRVAKLPGLCGAVCLGAVGLVLRHGCMSWICLWWCGVGG